MHLKLDQKGNVQEASPIGVHHPMGKPSVQSRMGIRWGMRGSDQSFDHGKQEPWKRYSSSKTCLVELVAEHCPVSRLT